MSETNRKLLNIAFNNGTCRTCKHWDEAGARNTYPVQDMPIGRFGDCQQIGIGYGGLDHHLVENIGALAIDPQDCIGKLVTGENFACIMWETKR